MGHTRIVNKGKFINLFQRENGWEFVSRNEVPRCDYAGPLTGPKPDAVVIVPFIVKDGAVRLVLTREWREPMGSWVLGLPAGLIDEGENAERAGRRELMEETGLKAGPCLYETPQLYSSEGLTDEAVVTVYFQCEGVITSENLEDGENIVTFTVDREEAMEIMGEDMGKIVYFVLEDFIRTGSRWLWG